MHIPGEVKDPTQRVNVNSTFYPREGQLSKPFVLVLEWAVWSVSKMLAIFLLCISGSSHFVLHYFNIQYINQIKMFVCTFSGVVGIIKLK